jgi:hypothetical protein
MAAPTNAALVKKVLANSEPSTHGPSRQIVLCNRMSAFGRRAEVTKSSRIGFIRHFARWHFVGAVGHRPGMKWNAYAIEVIEF